MKLADNFSVETAAAHTQTFAFIGRRGSGKTYAALLMAEQFLKDQMPLIWIDPIGVSFGLRTKFPVVIMGGDHADMPLDPSKQSARAIAEFCAEKRLSVILDISRFGEGEMRRFVAEFAQRFYEVNRQAYHIFVDEADEFAPQQTTSPDQSKSLGAMQNLTRRGRARGIGVTVITQRCAVLSKSVLNQTECLFALQMTAPQDLKAIQDWIKYHGESDKSEEIIRQLPKLQRGAGFVYSPGWLKKLARIQFLRRESFDSSATPEPGKAAKSSGAGSMTLYGHRRPAITPSSSTAFCISTSGPRSGLISGNRPRRQPERTASAWSR